MQISEEILDALTPERLKKLSRDEKLEAFWLIEQAELTGYQRYMKGLRERLEAERRAMAERGEQPHYSGLAEILANARKNLDDPNRKPSMLQQLANAPDEVARRARIAQKERDKIREDWIKLRRERPGPGGAWIDRFLSSPDA